MTVQDDRALRVGYVETFARPLTHPLYAYLLASATTLFGCALITDAVYFMVPEIQWKNFSSWLILGALVFGGFALLWAVIDSIRARRAERQSTLAYLLILLLVFVLGTINELLHAKDAFGTMPEGLIVSAISAVLAIIASILGFSHLRRGVL